MKAMGIIFANIYDSSLGELTNKRTIASLPYGGRYRQIDFTLSNMSNSGIRHIGIITKYNYQSLMNHIGSGQEWDLELEEGGLEYLTPFAMGHNGSYRGKVEALNSAMIFLENALEDYVVLADSNVLCNIDLDRVLEQHVESGKDVTVAVKAGIARSAPPSANGSASGIISSPPALTSLPCPLPSMSGKIRRKKAPSQKKRRPSRPTEHRLIACVFPPGFVQRFNLENVQQTTPFNCL